MHREHLAEVPLTHIRRVRVGPVTDPEGDPPKLLFICTGNYYRSRFAEILFNALASEARLIGSRSLAGLPRSGWRVFDPSPLRPSGVSRLEESESRRPIGILKKCGSTI